MAWTTEAKVAGWLGTDVPADPARLASVVAAANEYVTDRRAAAGYVDTDPPPAEGRVVEGATMLAGVAYRHRGVVDVPDLAGFTPGEPDAGTWRLAHRWCGLPRGLVV